MFCGDEAKQQRAMELCAVNFKMYSLFAVDAWRVRAVSVLCAGQLHTLPVADVRQRAVNLEEDSFANPDAGLT